MKIIDVVNSAKAEWRGSSTDAASLKGANGVMFVNSNYRLATKLCTYEEFNKCIDECTNIKLLTPEK